jgi:hypothetical protein
MSNSETRVSFDEVIAAANGDTAAMQLIIDDTRAIWRRAIGQCRLRAGNVLELDDYRQEAQLAVIFACTVIRDRPELWSGFYAVVKLRVLRALSEMSYLQSPVHLSKAGGKTLSEDTEKRRAAANLPVRSLDAGRLEADRPLVEVLAGSSDLRPTEKDALENIWRAEARRDLRYAAQKAGIDYDRFWFALGRVMESGRRCASGLRGMELASMREFLPHDLILLRGEDYPVIKRDRRKWLTHEWVNGKSRRLRFSKYSDALAYQRERANQAKNT